METCCQEDHMVLISTHNWINRSHWSGTYFYVNIPNKCHKTRDLNPGAACIWYFEVVYLLNQEVVIPIMAFSTTCTHLNNHIISALGNYLSTITRYRMAYKRVSILCFCHHSSHDKPISHQLSHFLTHLHVT